MINSIEEATQHAKHVKGVHVIVLPDGTIYSESNSELAQGIVDNNECFVVRGDLKKTVKASKKIKTENE